MGASDGTGACQEAAQYYYDLLCREDAAVPERIKGHVENCPFCREQVRRLGEVLAETDRDAGPSAGHTAAETVAALTAHLELVDEQVTCSRVKAFLPHLAAPSPEIGIPTPVTVHADRCPPCAADVAAIRALGLTADQLERLSRVFAESSRRSLMACRRARPTVAALGALSLEDVDTRTLNHISTCPRCRATVYRRRRQFQDAGAGVTCCTRVSTADLFDLVVPYGVAPAGQEEREAVLMHVRACPACVEKMQALHGLLYGIAERADSGITTVYSTRGRDERVGEEAQAAPPQYPVHVQVLQGGPEPAVGPDDLPAARRADARSGSPRSHRVSLAKIAFAAAAFALVSLLFTTTPTASGTNIGDILKAIQREPNIHVLSSSGRKSEPFREVWLARDLEVFATKMRAECVLFDLKERSRKIIDSDRGTCTTVRLTSREYRSVREFMMDCTGGVFASIPSDTRLQEVVADPAGASGPGTLVYELNATSQGGYGGDSAVSHRYRIFIDRATKLPQRIECFRKGPPENDWELSVFHTFEYVTERDMKDTIRAMCLGG
jgi:hypothetical protein